MSKYRMGEKSKNDNRVDSFIWHLGVLRLPKKGTVMLLIQLRVKNWHLRIFRPSDGPELKFKKVLKPPILDQIAVQGSQIKGN